MPYMLNGTVQIPLTVKGAEEGSNTQVQSLSSKPGRNTKKLLKDKC